VRLAAFAVLGGLCALRWGDLMADPPVGRIVLALGVACAGAASLRLVSARQISSSRRHLLGAVVSLATLWLALVAVGVPAHLLVPAGWDELGARIADGVRGLGDVDYPYGGGREWSRLVLLGGLAALLALAAALGFWPHAPNERPARIAGPAVLLGGYAAGVAIGGQAVSLWLGVALLAGLVAWLWVRQRWRREAVPALVAVAVAGAVAVPVAAALDRDEPWVAYEEWTWDPAESTVAFDWDHRYGPLDWPRDGTTLLEIESDKPHYWRIAVLDTFDGIRWNRSGLEGNGEELPGDVEGTGAAPAEEWSPRATVTVRALRSADLVSPGSTQVLRGIDAQPAGVGSMAAADLPAPGDGYSVVGYEPDPSAKELRDAPVPYDASLRRYTELHLLAGKLRSEIATDPDTDSLALTRPLRVPLREGPRAELRPGSRAVIDLAGYRQAYALARRLTDGRATPYAAVKAVQRHLRTHYLYSESPPVRPRPLPAFLFRDGLGYCQQFSGAMALLLRMAGVPSRVATGFSPGSPNGDGFEVRDLDAHSWVEVYFTGIGWVPFDPTPGVAPPDLQAGRGDFAATPRGAASKPAGKSQGSQAQAGSSAEGGGFPWSLVAALGGLLAAALVAASLARALRFRSLPAAEAQAAQVCELRSALPRVGHRVPPGATLQAMERRLVRASKPRAADYLARLRAGRFGAEQAPAPTLADRRAMRRELRPRWSLRGGLRALVALPPGGPAARGRGPAAG
jgi:protein-glutamine gamma-glutamyltransferase